MRPSLLPPILRVVQQRATDAARLRSQLSETLSTPQDIITLRKLRQLEPIHDAWIDWERNTRLLQDTQTLLTDTDPTMRELAQEEKTRLSDALDHTLNVTFPNLLKPQSTTARFSALVELKSAVGGAESSLFLADMLRMYQRYVDAAPDRWQHSLLSTNGNEGGGLKEAILEVKGPCAYDSLRWESGVHRVQRVPATEASGRTHTSTVAVIVCVLSSFSERSSDPFCRRCCPSQRRAKSPKRVSTR